MSRPCKNSFLASSEEVVTGIFPPADAAGEAAGAGAFETCGAVAQPLNAAALSAKRAAKWKSLEP